MAPKKEKAEKGEKSVSGEDGGLAIILKHAVAVLTSPPTLGSTMILKYLQQQNRPYSAIDISANLHNKVTKAYAVKALKTMHEQKLLECRVAGKQMVYHALQDGAEEATPEELAALDEEIKSLRESLETAKAREKALKTDLAVQSSRVSRTELLAQIDQCETRMNALSDQLARLRQEAATSRIVTEEEINKVNRNWAVWKRHALLRRQACRETWLKCTEVLPENVKTRGELWESLGMEGEL